MEPKIFIGIPVNDNMRFHDFNDCLDAMIKPPGTYIKRVPGGSIAKNRNTIIRLAMQEDYTHILFLDDDMVFHPDLLERLLSHNKDVVTANCLMRCFPFKPVIFNGINFNNDLEFRDIVNEKGLIKILASGLAATLIKCNILEKFAQYTSVGWLHPDELNEDISFYIELKRAGFEAYCDLDCHVGHHVNSVIWPNGKITVYNRLLGVLKNDII